VGVAIAKVLDRKGRQVVTTTADAGVDAAVAAMAEHNVGAMVVLDGDTVHGIISERDVVRALADGRVLHRSVAEIMTAPATTCTSATTTDELLATMTDGRFRHVPVVDDGVLVGIVSIGDVVKWQLDELREETQRLTEYVSGTY
jgi:CBS domain-containing protein